MLDSSTPPSDCVWAELSKRPDQKEAILEKYFSDDSTTQYNTVTIKTVDTETTAAVKKLEDYMYTKLQDAFYGEASSRSKGTKIIDHQVFYSLYKNQISKNIITTISSYCLEARSPDYIIPKDEKERAETRKKNIESLKQMKPSSGSSKESNAAYSAWGKCLKEITKVCQKTPATDVDVIYSVQRACVVSDSLRQLRQGLIAAEKMDKQFKSEVDTRGFQVSNVKTYTGRGGDDTKSIDELTSITSNEFANESGYKKELKAKQATIAECKRSKDYGPCRKYLGDVKEKQQLEQALVEYDLRQKILSEKLASMDDSDLKAFLETEGRSQRDIERALASDDSKQLVKKQINDAFAAEKNAIRKQIESSINKTNLESNTEKTEAQQFESKFDIINKELSQQANDYTQLIHYNNIVSGFLTVQDSSGKDVGTNIQSINRELSDSAYNGGEANSGPRSPASGSYMEKLSEKLNEMVKGKGEVDKDKQHDSTPIGTGTINKHIFDMNYGDERQE